MYSVNSVSAPGLCAAAIRQEPVCAFSSPAGPIHDDDRGCVALPKMLSALSSASVTTVNGHRFLPNYGHLFSPPSGLLVCGVLVQWFDSFPGGRLGEPVAV
jgi:hypothetical protein